MNMKLATTCFVLGTLLTPIVASADDNDMDRSHPGAFISDSVITTKIKTKLAAENLATTTQIKVDTDAKGVVWLSGSAKTQGEIDKVVQIAHNTDGVVSVKNHIKVRSDN